LSRARSNEIADYNQSGADANADLERFNAAQLANRFDELEPSPYRPLGIILVRLRVAEVHKHAVTHVLRYEAAEALHSLGDTLLIARNDLAQVLRVHTRRECCRTDKV
jgi:hypothetical protein